MQVVAGILSLVGAVVFPMGMLAWLSRRLSRKPALTAQRVGLLLALNGVLPVGLVILGLILLSSRLWEALGLRIALGAAWLTTAVLLILLATAALRARGGKDHG